VDKEQAIEIMCEPMNKTTHDIARALLALDPQPLDYEDHGEVWSHDLVDQNGEGLDLQICVRSY
jgi:hypothetical protein